MQVKTDNRTYQLNPSAKQGATHSAEVKGGRYPSLTLTPENLTSISKVHTANQPKLASVLSDINEKITFPGATLEDALNNIDLIYESQIITGYGANTALSGDEIKSGAAALRQYTDELTEAAKLGQEPLLFSQSDWAKEFFSSRQSTTGELINIGKPLRAKA